MPTLDQDFMTQLARHLLQNVSLPTSMTVYPLAPTPPAVAYDFTVQNRKGATTTLLRTKATGDPLWYADRRSLSNGARVRIRRQAVDGQGYEMVYVSDGRVQGWLYAINIVELR